MPDTAPSDDTRLVSSAQQSEANVNNVNSDDQHVAPPPDEIHVAKCFKCGETPLAVCRHCGHEFCNNHRSKYSDQYCYLCIAPDNLGLEYLPLEEEEIDPETGKAVVHHGRRLKLIGEGWPNTMQMINSMDDTGLEVLIAERQKLLKEAIETTEYHRITLSALTFTRDYKKHSKAAKLERRYKEISQGAVRLSGKTHRVSSVKKTDTEDEKLMKLLGLNAEQLRAFKKVMNKV